MRIRLGENAFDALREMHFLVVERGNDADEGQRLSFQLRLLFFSQKVTEATVSILKTEASLWSCSLGILFASID
jgi:hypothetical protein